MVINELGITFDNRITSHVRPGGPMRTPLGYYGIVLRLSLKICRVMLTLR